MAAGEQIAFKPALTHVLAEHLHHAAGLAQIHVDRKRLGDPGLARVGDGVTEAIGGRFVGAKDAEVFLFLVGLHHVVQKLAEHARRFHVFRAAILRRHVDGEVAEVRHVERLQQQSAVGVRRHAHALPALGRDLLVLGFQVAGGVEQLLGLVAAHPLLKLLQVFGMLEQARQRHLMRAPGAFDRQPVDDLRTGPALGCAQNQHRPGGALYRLALGHGRARLGLNLGDAVEDCVEGCGCFLVHLGRVAALNGVRLVAVAAHQALKLCLRNAAQQCRVGDLVAVQMQNRQHHAIGGRVQKFIGMPACGERPGLGLAVANHAGHDQIRVVEDRAEGMHQRVAEFAAFVNRSGRLGRHVARDAVGPTELAEEPFDAVPIALDMRIDLRV